MRSIGHFIGGKEVKGNSGRTADVFEPMTGDVQAKVALASKAEVRAAVENAKAAQPEWAATNPQRRARVMMKFVELVQRDYDKLADCLARETEMNARSSGTSIGRLNVDKRDPLSRRERIPHLPAIGTLPRGVPIPANITAKCEGREAGSAVLCVESRLRRPSFD